MKQIALTKGEFALVDDDDYENLIRFKWSVIKPKRRTYARSVIGGRHYYMHRLIMDAPIGIEVDHIDHNGLNNCRSNLRLATRLQNVHNSRKRTDNTSGHVGVYWNKLHKKWNCQITVNKKRIYLGHAFDVNEAADLYNSAAKKHFGEFYPTNI